MAGVWGRDDDASGDEAVADTLVCGDLARYRLPARRRLIGIEFQIDQQVGVEQEHLALPSRIAASDPPVIDGDRAALEIPQHAHAEMYHEWAGSGPEVPSHPKVDYSVGRFMIDKI